MADQTARFAIKLDDETSGAANAAAGALEKLRQKIEQDQAALRSMQAAMKTMQSGTVVNAQAYKSLSSQIEQKRAAIQGATADFVNLGGSFMRAKKPTAELGKAAAGSSANMRDLIDASEASGGALSGVLRWAKDLTEGLGQGGMAGALVLAGGLMVGLLVGGIALVVGGIAKLIGMAITATEELKDMSLALQSAAIQGKHAADSGDEFLETVIAVSKGVSISRNQVQGFAQQLLKAGVSGNKLGEALEAVSIAESVGADSGKVLADLKAAAKTGASISAIADKIKGKYGALADDKMKSFSVQFAKAKENATLLFAGVKTGPLLDAVARLLKFLDASTVEGAALKTMIETLLNPIIDGIGKAGPAAKQFFQGMIIGALQVAIVMLLVKKRIEDAIGLKVDLKAVDWTMLGQAVMFCAAALGLVVGAIAIAVVWIGLMTAGVLLVAGGFIALAVAAAVGIGMLVSDVVGGIVTLLNFLISRAAAFVDIGAQFMLGLSQGITDGMSSVISAAVGVAKGAVKAVKDELGIHSPSTVAVGIADNFTGTMADRTEANVGDVAGAAGSIGEAMIPPKQGSALGGGGGGGGMTLVIEQLIVNGVDGADDPQFSQKLADALQEAAIIAGIKVVA